MIDRPKTPTLAEIKAAYDQRKAVDPRCVTFFRMGDFYEMYYDDAILVHKTLGVAITHRSKGQPMAGVPYHSLESYIRRMISAGHRVAICDL
jgi:DNA mismatch repair protein MutS